MMTYTGVGAYNLQLQNVLFVYLITEYIKPKPLNNYLQIITFELKDIGFCLQTIFVEHNE